METFRLPHNGAYQPYELDALGKAFDAVWETISAHRPYSTDMGNEGLKEAVSDRLCQIASMLGTTDVESLRSATLESFSFTPES